MHPNPAFRQTDADQALRFACEVGFGVLAVNGPEGPLLAYIPFVLEGRTALLHLVRSNPICRALGDGAPATLAVSGPHGYVSPDWYGLDDQVPTWNYVAVHLKGHLRPTAPETLDHHIAALSEAFETRLRPKQPWTLDKMTPEALERMKRGILPFALDILDVQSTYKLGQNKPAAAIQGAAQGLAGSDIGQDLPTLAALMRATAKD
jgi:transcriptional regulator